MRRILLSFSFIVCYLSFGVAHTVTSPDGKYVVTVDGMTYRVEYNGKEIIQKSQLGIDIDNRLFESALGVPRGVHDNWSKELVLESANSFTSIDTVWTPLYGENQQIHDHYNELVLHYAKGSGGRGTVAEGYDKRMYYAMDIIFRAYNEGIAFRYHFPETANSLFLHITGEQTSFAMPAGTKAWYEEWAQGPYQVKSLEIRDNSWFESERPLLMLVHSPLDGPGEATYVALLEAAMKDYTRGKFKLAADNVLQVAMYDCADIISPYDTPWRVIMAGNRAVDLINHKDLVLNLNAERAEADWSWVRPGKRYCPSPAFSAVLLTTPCATSTRV